jgi:hypothetical protein
MPTVVKRVEKSCHLPAPGPAEGAAAEQAFGSLAPGASSCSAPTTRQLGRLRRGGGTRLLLCAQAAEVGRRKAVGDGVTDVKGRAFLCLFYFLN